MAQRIRDELTIGQHKKCKKKLNWNMDQYTSNFAIPEHDIGIISQYYSNLACAI